MFEFFVILLFIIDILIFVLCCYFSYKYISDTEFREKWTAEIIIEWKSSSRSKTGIIYFIVLFIGYVVGVPIWFVKWLKGF